MNGAAGFLGKEVLQEDAGSILYRGRVEPEDAPVLVRVPAASGGDAAGLEREYALRDELDPAWAVRPLALLRQGGRLQLVLDDPGGEPLERRLDGAMAVDGFLPLAIGLAGALAAMHGRGLIHKDIKPAHVLVDAAGGVRFTGFGSASLLPRERQAPAAPEAIAGSLAYMAPEQTGRMNRSLDSRADLYALGVTFYRMLTGAFPFTAGDPMEWVHCHLARQALPPAERSAAIPAGLSAIVMKLLAKTAEERYQSAAGLRADLLRCLGQWRATRRIEPFVLGTRDVPAGLRIPEKLYGREHEVDSLLAAWGRVLACGRPEWILVSGYSGVGKSAVVHELHRALVAPRGLFLSGKFDQYRRDIPYDTLAQAFRTLVGELLSRSEAELGRWREAIRAAAGAHGRLLLDLIPELEHVVGPQPEVPGLAPREAEHRFHNLFRRFLAVFARAEHPLVLFLDDLQWLDAASLKLVEHLVTHPEVRHLLLIGAYRDNEVGAAHPLRLALEAVRRAGAAVGEIALAPLSRHDLDRMLAEALRCRPARVEPLSRLVFEKTGGNPFFAIQFLAALADEGLLAYAVEPGAWRWDLAGIRARGYTDNVVDLMLGKLRRLPAPAQKALAGFACLGNRADAATLALACGQAPAALHAALWPAVRAGLVLCQGEGYRFAHDRIQEAAYALAAAADRPALHLAMARRLAAGGAPAGGSERVFELAGQFNEAAELIEAPAEREQVAALNAQAGRQARAAIAYAAARAYLVRAVAFLPAEAWSERHEESFALHLDLAECEYLVGRYQEADARFGHLLHNAATDFDRARVHRLRQKLYQMAGRFHDTVAATREALRLLGMELPDGDDGVAAAVAAQRREIEVALAGRRIGELAELPLAADPQVRLLVGLIAESLVAAYNASPPLFPLLTALGVNLSLQRGNTAEASTCYSCYAVIKIFEGDPAAGYEFSELAVRLVESFAASGERADDILRHGMFANHWRYPIASSPAYLEQAFAAAQSAGNLISAGYGAANRTSIGLETGIPLDECLAQSRKYAAFALESHNTAIHAHIRVVQQFVACLQGRTRSASSFEDADFDEAACLATFAAANWGHGIGEFHVRKLSAAVYYGDYAEALRQVELAAAALPQIAPLPLGHACRFFHALTLAALHDEAPAEQGRAFRSTLDELLACFAAWARHCPANYRCRHALIAAEVARLDGRELEAMGFYEDAIAAARADGFPQYEALACEVAARFYRGLGLATNAAAHLEHARAAYAAWGAAGKLGQLDRQHPRRREAGGRSAADPSLGQFDLMTVVKASQAVSGEIVLDRLLQILMEIALEHAGADRGLLLLRQGESLLMAAEATVEGERVAVRRCRSAASAAQLPESVLNYVVRARTSLILDDAPACGQYGADPYVAGQRPRSVLCLPLVKQGSLVGVLYLENRLATRVFTPDRLAVLELLASQAAIAIANASLYAELQEENQERRRAEAAVRESEARFRRLVESNVIGVIFWDTHGRIGEANDAFLALVGYSREDLLAGRLRWTDVTPPEYAEADRRAIAEALETGACRPYEKEFVRRDGHRVPALVGGSFLAESREQGVGFVLDLSERQAAEAERQARQAAEAANRAKSEFLTHMSHELRTPLNAIIGYANILKREPARNEQRTLALDTIEQSGLHLLTLINDLLDLAKIEAGKLELYPAPLALDVFLPLLANIICVRIEEKGLAFAFVAAPDPLPAVRADEKRLRQVLLNLLANALKFTDRGQVSLKVQVLAREGATAQLRFEVADTGVGMAPEQLDSIFRPFEQVGEASRRAGGTGLGLAISRRLVRLMGGEIEVESEPGRGSRFWFDLILPLAEAEVAAQAAPHPEALLPNGGHRPGLAGPAAMALPPHDEIKVLHDLALTGHMRDIRDWADRLSCQDERYRPFAERLQALARGYQSKAILALVEEILCGGQRP